MKYNVKHICLSFFIIFFCIIIFLYFKPKYSEGFDFKKTFIQSNGNIIPKIIIQTWKTNNIPNNYLSDINSIKTKNPDYEYKFFTDDDIDIFFNQYYPNYYNTYKKLPINIQKFDFFRYVAVYHYGGFYFDLDITALEPLDDLLMYDCVFPIDDFININMCKLNRYKYFCDNNLNFLLGQYAFAAKPKNDFILLLINSIHNNIDEYIKTYDSKKYINYEIYVYQTTGPDFVTKLYLDYKYKSNINILEYNQRQYFGKYARHNYYGSWKKNLKN